MSESDNVQLMKLNSVRLMMMMMMMMMMMSKLVVWYLAVNCERKYI